MNVELEPCALIAPRNDGDWNAYHDIRRRILFESRGERGVYDANQRQGLGRTLLALAEEFARAQAVTRVESSVARDVVPFYLKCGYRLVGVAEADAPHPQMCKDLRP